MTSRELTNRPTRHVIDSPLIESDRERPRRSRVWRWLGICSEADQSAEVTVTATVMFSNKMCNVVGWVGAMTD